MPDGGGAGGGGGGVGPGGPGGGGPSLVHSQVLLSPSHACLVLADSHALLYAAGAPGFNSQLSAARGPQVHVRLSDAHAAGVVDSLQARP